MPRTDDDEEEEPTQRRLEENPFVAIDPRPDPEELSHAPTSQVPRIHDSVTFATMQYSRYAAVLLMQFMSTPRRLSLKLHSCRLTLRLSSTIGRFVRAYMLLFISAQWCIYTVSKKTVMLRLMSE